MREIRHPEREGIFLYYTHENAPWEYFQPAFNAHAPEALLIDAVDEWTTFVTPEMRIEGAGMTPTGRWVLHVHGDDEEAAHDLDGTPHDTEADAHRAAFNGGLKAFRVAD